jgi:uncharacterized protein YceK
MRTLLLAFLLGCLISGCSSAKLMKNCKHVTENYYKCEDV